VNARKGKRNLIKCPVKRIHQAPHIPVKKIGFFLHIDVLTHLARFKPMYTQLNICDCSPLSPFDALRLLRVTHEGTKNGFFIGEMQTSEKHHKKYGAKSSLFLWVFGPSQKDLNRYKYLWMLGINIPGKT
jgi:hypothetical protein